MKNPCRCHSKRFSSRRLKVEPLETRRVLTEILVTPVAGTLVDESGGAADFDVVLTSEPTADVTVSLLLSDEGEGTLSEATLTFTPTNWDVGQSVTVAGAADNLVDADVAFDLMATATSTDAVYDGVAVADVSITNENKDTATISIAAAQVAEGRPGVAGTLQFVVTLDTAIEGGVMVGAATRALTATSGADYPDTIGRLEFSGTAGETDTFRVSLLGDFSIEGNETLEAVLGVISGLGAGIDPADVTLGQSTAVGTITEDDLGDIGFTVTATDFNEQAGTQTLSITLLTTASGELSEAISVRVADLLTGSADPTDDYTFVTQTVEFAAGSGDQETQTITIAITDDQRIETNETIDLGLEIIGDGINGAVGAAQQTELTVTITDDPQTGVISGTVRVDSNNDGVVQAGERPIAGVTVQLTGTNSLGEAVSLEQVTDADGTYHFEGITAGEYRITQVQPANYVTGSETLGTVAGTADGVASDNQFDEITLPAAATAEGYDFSELGLAASFVDVRSFLATTLAAATAPAPIAAAMASTAAVSSNSAASSDAAVATLVAETPTVTPTAIAFAVATDSASASTPAETSTSGPVASLDLAYAAYAMFGDSDDEDDSPLAF